MIHVMMCVLVEIVWMHTNKERLEGASSITERQQQLPASAMAVGLLDTRGYS
jgi:hypothetical protein